MNKNYIRLENKQVKTKTEIIFMLNDLKTSFDYHIEEGNKTDKKKADKKEHQIGQERAAHQAEVLCWVLNKEWADHKQDFIPLTIEMSEPKKTTFQNIINSYHWETDPGHGWLVVPAHHLTEMKVQNKISTCSYISDDGKIAYLEEDCDAARFLESLENKKLVKAAAKNWKDNFKENTFVRSLPRFSSDKIAKS